VNRDRAVWPKPDEDLKKLGERLVGKAEISGGATGSSRCEWLDGGFFLVQHVDIEQNGLHIKGAEIIGHLKPFGAGPSPELRSRFYDNHGNTLDYVYELSADGKTLTVWGGERGSPAYYRGIFGDDGVCHGEWNYPGGGGYKMVTRSVR
jgi:hypothetical protein